MQKKKSTIGLLMDWAANSFGLRLWAGAADYAKEHDANLVCFVGGSINSPHLSERLRNEIINFINPSNLDGLIIITSVISQFMNNQEVIEFFARFKSFPVISVGRKIPQIPSITIDNRTGMTKLLTHLIRFHGYKKIAFIKGPHENFDSRERYEVFCETVQAEGLRIDHRLIYQGQYDFLSGRAAVDWFIRRQKIKPDVIVSANDEMAKGAIEALRDKSILVPGEIAVVGFDDIESNQTVIPSMTTVRQPLYEQGQKAAEITLDLINKKEVELETKFPTYIILRESCGCFIPRFSGLLNEPPDDVESLMEKINDDILNKVNPMIENETFIEEDFDSSLVKSGFVKVIESYLSELFHDRSDVFFTAWHHFLTRIQAHEKYLNLWKEILSIINEVSQYYIQGEIWEKSKELIKKARDFLFETENKWYQFIRIKQANENIALRAIGEQLTGTISLSEIIDLLERSFPKLGIKSCYMALTHMPYQADKTSRLVMGFNENGILDLSFKGRDFLSSKLLPDNILPENRSFMVMVDVLYQSQNQIGYFVLEMDPREGIVYENIARRLRSALKGTLLLEQVRYQAIELQVSNESLHNEIREKKEVEKELRDSEIRLKAIIEANPIPLTIYREEDGIILFSNENFSETFDIPMENLKNKNIRDFFNEERDFIKLRTMLKKSCFEDKAFINNHEVLMQKDSGTNFWAVISIQSLMFNGELAGILSFYDITERKRLEKEILSISEREQRRIAQDLHDGLGQLLTGISFMTRVLEEELKKKSLPEADSAAEISRLINQSLQFNKNIIRGSFPVELEENDLVHALQDLLTKTEAQYNLKYEFQCDNEIYISDKAKSLHLFRIAQEAIFNIVKHARASYLRICLQEEISELVLIISDNGIGLPKNKKSSTGMGLRIMQYRANIIGGNILYNSNNGSGTKVICRVPIKSL